MPEERVEPVRLTLVQRFGEVMADKVERWMPSPFVFAIILTYVAGLAAFISEGSGVTEIASAWYDGFWSLLQFAMQMVIILVTATVVAYHPRVRGMILRLVRLPKSGRQAVVLVAVLRPSEAFSVASAAVDFTISEAVDGVQVITALIPKAIFPDSARRLR
jgi:short subunit fatty acids transporter